VIDPNQKSIMPQSMLPRVGALSIVLTVTRCFSTHSRSLARCARGHRRHTTPREWRHRAADTSSRQHRTDRRTQGCWRYRQLRCSRKQRRRSDNNQTRKVGRDVSRSTFRFFHRRHRLYAPPCLGHSRLQLRRLLATSDRGYRWSGGSGFGRVPWSRGIHTLRQSSPGLRGAHFAACRTLSVKTVRSVRVLPAEGEADGRRQATITTAAAPIPNPCLNCIGNSF